VYGQAPLWCGRGRMFCAKRFWFASKVFQSMYPA
jgi:hypothetical protein